MTLHMNTFYNKYKENVKKLSPKYTIEKVRLYPMML